MALSPQQAVFHELQPIDGFYDIEHDFWGWFVWAKKRFSVNAQNGVDYFSVELCYYGSNGKLWIQGPEGNSRKIDLYQGWHNYPVDASGFRNGRISFELNEIINVPGDSRELGIMIRRFRPLSDEGVFHQVSGVLANEVQNHEEFLRGSTILATRPPKILVSLVNRCTMETHCAYCDRDRTIPLEKKQGFEFSTDTLDEMGEFYRRAGGIGDNSRGEPFLKPDLRTMSARTDRDDKLVELVTNGQVRGMVERHELLGKKLAVYCSIDSATREGYARYRNEKFDRVVENLRSLCLAKKSTYNLPVVLVTFVSMRSNMHEIDPFLDLAKDIGVDGVKLRTLNRDPFLMNRRELRNGYWFDYSQELLTGDEMRALSESAKQKARSKGVDLIAETDFSPIGADNKTVPICSEPWKCMQILNVGIVTCIFGRNRPVAFWSERGGRPLEQFLWDVWNGEAYRRIRSELASGRIPEHCRHCHSCPIVRKHFHRV